jgi:hypothetical protein
MNIAKMQSAGDVGCTGGSAARHAVGGVGLPLKKPQAFSRCGSPGSKIDCL